MYTAPNCLDGDAGGLRRSKSKSSHGALASHRSSTDGKSRPSTTDKPRSSGKGADGSALVSPYLQSTRLLASFSPPASKAAQRLQQKAFDAAFDFSSRSAVRTASPLRPASQPGTTPHTTSVPGYGKSAPSSPASKQRPRHKPAHQGDISSDDRCTSAAPLSQACAPTTSPHSLPHPPTPTPPPQHAPQQQLPHQQQQLQQQQQQQVLRTGAAGRLLQAYGQPPTISPYTQRLAHPSTPDPAHHQNPAAGTACGTTLARTSSLSSSQRSSAGSGRSSTTHGQSGTQGQGEGTGSGNRGCSRGRAAAVSQNTAFGRSSLEPRSSGQVSSRRSSTRSPEGLPRHAAARQSNSSAGGKVPIASSTALGQSINTAQGQSDVSCGSSPAESSRSTTTTTTATTRAGGMGAEAGTVGESPGRAFPKSARSTTDNTSNPDDNNNNNNSGSSSGSHNNSRHTETPTLPHPAHHQLQQQQHQRPPSASVRPPSQPSQGAALRSSQQWQPASTAMSEGPSLPGTAERPQAPATAAHGSFRRSRRGEWPSSHGSSPREAMANSDARSMRRSASGAFADEADDPMDGAVSDDYLEDAPLTGNSVDIPVVVTDGPTVVRVVSADMGAGRGRDGALGGSRPPSALAYFSSAATGSTPGPPGLGRQASRPPSAYDPLAHAHARPYKMSGSSVGGAGGGSRGSRPSSGRCPWLQLPGHSEQECPASQAASLSSSFKRSLEGGGLPSPSSASGMQYEDIPDVPWEDGEESWTEAAEEDEAADPAYQGLTLASYMSKLVTTPASAAATSGLSGHQRQGGAALAAPPSPKPLHSPQPGITTATTPSPPPQSAWPSQAPHRSTQPAPTSSGQSPAPLPSMLGMPQPLPPPPQVPPPPPAGAAAGVDPLPSVPRTPSARALCVPEQGPSPWHQPLVNSPNGAPRNLAQLGSQQQLYQEEEEGEEGEEEAPDPQLPSDSDSLASLGAQVPRWQDDDEDTEEEGSIQEGLVREDDAGPIPAQAKSKPDGSEMWRKASIDGHPLKLIKSQPLERGPHSGSMGPLHTMPIVSSAAAALSNSLDLRPATASASYSLNPARRDPPFTPHSPSSSSSPQGSPPSSPQDLTPSAAHPTPPSHAHKLTHSHRHHHHHFREPSMSESGHVKEVDLGGLSSELFSYSSSSNKPSGRRQMPVPLQLQLEQADIKVHGLHGGDTGQSSPSSVQSTGPSAASFSRPQPASSSRERGDSSSASARPAASPSPAPDLAHPLSQGPSAVTGASTRDGAPPVAPLSSPGAPHHDHGADSRSRATQGLGGCSHDSNSKALPAGGSLQPPAPAHSPVHPSPSSTPLGTATATQRSGECSRAGNSRAGHLQPHATPSPTSPHLFKPSHPSLAPTTSPSSAAGAQHSTTASTSLPEGSASTREAQASYSLQQHAPQAPRELHPVRPPPRLAFDANGSVSTSSEAGPLLTRNQHSSSELSALLPHSPSAWAQRVAPPPRAISNPTDEATWAQGQQAGEPAAALAAAAAASMMRPVAPPPGGVRAVQSARPITRNGPAPDFSVWQGSIAQQLERPPSRQKPPPEALHLWSPEESRSTLMGLPAGPNPDLNSAYHSGPRLRARPHSAMVTLGGGGHGRSILSGAALKAQPANVPYGGMTGQHARLPTRERPPTRQRPPPMALLLEQHEEDAECTNRQGDGLEGGERGMSLGKKGARGGRGQGLSVASVQELSSDSSDE